MTVLWSSSARVGSLKARPSMELAGNQMMSRQFNTAAA